MLRWILPLVTAAALAAVGCGGDDDRLTREEFSARLRPAVNGISDGFGAVYAGIGRAEEGEQGEQGVVAPPGARE